VKEERAGGEDVEKVLSKARRQMKGDVDCGKLAPSTLLAPTDTLARTMLDELDNKVSMGDYEKTRASFARGIELVCISGVPEPIAAKLKDIGLDLLALVRSGTPEENEMLFTEFLAVCRANGLSLHLTSLQPTLQPFSAEDNNNNNNNNNNNDNNNNDNNNNNNNNNDNNNSNNNNIRAADAEVAASQVISVEMPASAVHLLRYLRKFVETRDKNWAKRARDEFPLDTALEMSNTAMPEMFDSVIKATDTVDLLKKSIERMKVTGKIGRGALARKTFAHACTGLTYASEAFRYEMPLWNSRKSLQNREVRRVAGVSDVSRPLNKGQFYDLLLCGYLPPAVSDLTLIKNARWYRSGLYKIFPPKPQARDGVSALELLLFGTQKAL
jgi:hypothetical protein